LQQRLRMRQRPDDGLAAAEQAWIAAGFPGDAAALEKIADASCNR